VRDVGARIDGRWLVFTAGVYRPQTDIDQLKSEGIWNNDGKLSGANLPQEAQVKSQVQVDYEALVTFSILLPRTRSQNWTGYICNEPLLLQPSYLEQLSAAGIPWGFSAVPPAPQPMSWKDASVFSHS